MKHVRFGDLGDLFDGPHATPSRRDSGPYFLNIASLSNGRLDLTLSDHVSTEDFVRWTKRVQPAGDDLLFSYETRLGEAALMPRHVRACLGRRMALLRPNPAVVDPKYLLYYYISPRFRSFIQSRTIHGATVPRIPLSQMTSWPVTLPELPEQHAIAAVLGALDDKIAANNTLARTADNLASVKYRAWTSSMPRIPLTSQASPILGGTPDRKNSDLWGTGHFWASARDIVGAPNGVLLSTEETITDEAARSKRLRPHPRGSVVLTARGTVGAVARLAVPSAVNQSCYAFHPSSAGSALLYFNILQAVDRAKSMAHGSVFSTITMSTFEHLQVPDVDEIPREMANHLQSLLDASEQAVRENRALALLRDTLLPQLMSGKLRVKDAERQVEDTV